MAAVDDGALSGAFRDAPAPTIEIQGQDDQDNKRRIRSGKDGRFRIDLAPGKYTLTPMAPNPGAPAQRKVSKRLHELGGRATSVRRFL